MSRDKQIEEMAKLICNCYDNGICEIDEKPCDLECGSVENAKVLYNAGYRKASEVAKEIFAEIVEKGKVDEPIVEYYILSYSELAELKKKYTEGEG